MNTPEAGPPAILVVEDIDWIRAGMARSLRRHGYRAAEASDAAGALEITRRQRIALILTEEELPTFDSLLARVARLPAADRPPVVIVNPDANGNTRHGDAVVITDYSQLRTLLPD